VEFDIPNDRCTRIRIKSSGQVIDAIPAVARAMLNGGTAELVKSSGGAAPETARIAPPERAVAPAQNAPPKKPGDAQSPKGKARSGR
jgi:hypothetical protein